MSTPYYFQLDTDFPNGLDVNLLQLQINSDPIINATTICTTITVDTVTEVVTITFSMALTETQQTELTIIIANTSQNISQSPLYAMTAYTDPEAIQIAATGTGGGIRMTSDTGGLAMRSKGYILRGLTTTPVSLADSDATLSPAQLLAGILYGVPTTSRNLTMPAASDLVDTIGAAQVGDLIEFYIINNGGGGSWAIISVGTFVGNSSGIVTGAHFIVRLDDITSESESYSLYRLD